jgi:hypothetical protein
MGFVKIAVGRVSAIGKQHPDNPQQHNTGGTLALSKKIPHLSSLKTENFALANFFNHPASEQPPPIIKRHDLTGYERPLRLTKKQLHPPVIHRLYLRDLGLRPVARLGFDPLQ